MEHHRVSGSRRPLSIDGIVLSCHWSGDGIVHIVPNGEISVASNFTKSFSRVNLDITVAYKEDLDHVTRVLNRVGNALASDEYFGPLIIETPQVIRVNSFDDSGIGIKVLGVTRPIRQWEVMGELRRRIKREFDREGIEIPFPHRTIYWGVDSHPSIEQQASEERQKRRAEDRPETVEVASRDPWVQEFVDGSAIGERLGGSFASSTNLMAHLDEVREVFQHPPTGLFTDIDGTLAWIAPSPKVAKISASVRQSLEQLSRRMSVVILTGRDVTSARSLLGLTSVIYQGNHGLESWENRQASVIPEAQPLKRQMQRLTRTARNNLSSRSGLLIEDKGLSVAFHYRQTSDPIKARDSVLEFLAKSPEARGLTIYEGKMVVEARMALPTNKGSALRRVVETRELKSALVLGDDLTDVDSFRMMTQLREEGVLNGISVAIQGLDTPSELLALADYNLSDTESVEIFLGWLAEETSKA